MKDFFIFKSKHGEFSDVILEEKPDEKVYGYDEYIHVRTVTDEEITDTMMLDWMIEKHYYVGEFMNTYRLLISNVGPLSNTRYKTPREAIKAAMREEKKV